MKPEKFLRYSFVAAALALLLGGCGFFKTHTDYDKAIEARPLDVPPDLDTPSTAGELVVPPAGAGAGRAAVAATMPPGAVSNVASTPGGGVHINDTVASAWSRVGLALERGKVGTIVSRDEAAHTYSVDVSVASGPKPGFFKRIIGGKQAVSVNRVTVLVEGSGDAADVGAQGDPAAVRQVMDVLRERLS